MLKCSASANVLPGSTPFLPWNSTKVIGKNGHEKIVHGKNGHAFNEMILIIFKYQYLSARIFAFRYHFIFLLHIP